MRRETGIAVAVIICTVGKAVSVVVDRVGAVHLAHVELDGPVGDRPPEEPGSVVYVQAPYTVELLATGPLDVVHSPSPLLIPTSGAARLVTIHDIDFLMHPERAGGEVRRDYPPLARAHAHRADAIVVPSRYTREQVTRRLSIPSDRVVVCPNGAPDWPLRTPPNPGGHLLFVGTIAPRKNVARLLEAYARLREVCPVAPQLVLAGQSAIEADELLATLRQPRYAGYVRYEGYVSEERLRSLYTDASAVILPSLDEGFGIPALEAMTPPRKRSVNFSEKTPQMISASATQCFFYLFLETARGKGIICIFGNFYLLIILYRTSL